MTRDEFLKILKLSSVIAYDFAKNYVVDGLPEDFGYSVILNASFDDPGAAQFDIYPEDDNKKVELISETAVADLLCRNNKIPVWIDIAVECIYREKTIFRLICAGRYSDNEDEFYYNKSGRGPFGIKGPALPADYVDGQKFRLPGYSSPSSLF